MMNSYSITYTLIIKDTIQRTAMIMNELQATVDCMLYCLGHHRWNRLLIWH